MNFQVIAVGFLVQDYFKKQMELVALEQQRMARGSMLEISHYLRMICPRRSGMMASLVRGCDFKRRGRWGFSFFVGWRASDFYGKFYPRWTLYGTGIYGLYGRPIIARQAPRLAWQDKSGKWISKVEVKGQPGKPVLKQAQNYGVKLLRQNLKFAYLRSMRTGK